MSRIKISKKEKTHIRNLQESNNRSDWGTSIWETSPSNPKLQEQIKKLNEEDAANKMMECQENNVGDLTPQDEEQFGILFNSVDPMGTDENAVYSVISKDNYNYFNSTVRIKFDKRIKCIKGDEFDGIIDFIISDFSGQERKKVRDMMLKTVRR